MPTDYKLLIDQAMKTKAKTFTPVYTDNSMKDIYKEVDLPAFSTNSLDDVLLTAIAGLEACTNYVSVAVPPKYPAREALAAVVAKLTAMKS